MDPISRATRALRVSPSPVEHAPASQALPRVRVAEMRAPAADRPVRAPGLAAPRVTARPAPLAFPTPTVRAAYDTIGGSYIEPIDAQQLTVAGLRGLSRLEPSVGAERVGDTLRVTWEGLPFLELPFANASVEAQLDVARRVVEQVTQRSRILAARSATDLTQLYVFGMKGELDRFTRYLTPTELAQTYARLGVATRAPAPVVPQGPASPSPTASEPVTVHRVERAGLPADTAIVRLSAFAENTADELARMLTPLAANGVTKIVIDLRGVGGGIVESAAQAADLFLARGRTLDLRARDREYAKRFEAQPNSPLEALQVVLVVDGATASAAEAFAAALGDAGHAPLVGRATFSKGRAQAIVPLPSGEGLSLSIGELVGPTGARIHDVGLMPAVCDSGAVTAATYAELAQARRGEVTRGRTMITNACPAAPALDDRGVDEAVRLLEDASAFAQARERQRALAGTPGSG